MIKNLLLGLFVFISLNSHAQIQISKLIGKNSSEFKLGYGAFLKFSYPVSEGSDVTLEGGANVFLMKDYPEYGWVVVPVKAGYRYTLNQSGTGFYIEPQLGYNVYGIDPDDNKFTGLILGAGVGHLFQPGGGVQFALGLLYESALHQGGAANYLSLRLTHNFTFRKRDNY